MTETLISVPDRPDVYLERVDIEHSPREDRWTPEHWTCWPIWAGVDRPKGAGIACTSMKLAERLRAAMLAGAAFGTPELREDVSGQTYVHASHLVLARMLNADLRRLGY